jgi:hypothetical protein
VVFPSRVEGVFHVKSRVSCGLIPLLVVVYSPSFITWFITWRRGMLHHRRLLLACRCSTTRSHDRRKGSSEPPPSSLQPVGLHAHRPQGDAGELPSPGSVTRRSSAARGAPFGACRPEMARPAAGRSWRSNHLIYSRKRELCWSSGRSICSWKSGSRKGLLASAGGAAARGGASSGAEPPMARGCTRRSETREGRESSCGG